MVNGYGYEYDYITRYPMWWDETKVWYVQLSSDMGMVMIFFYGIRYQDSETCPRLVVILVEMDTP